MAAMGRMVLLACAAAVFPLLIACVAIMISRPNPRRLLLAFYAGGVIVSVSSGLVVLAFFEDDSVTPSASSDPSPVASILTGLVALMFAWLMASDRGHGLLDQRRGRRAGRRASAERAKEPSWAQRQLGHANARLAFAVGAVINLPGPFYLLALGDIASGAYSGLEQLGLILLFN